MLCIVTRLNPEVSGLALRISHQLNPNVSNEIAVPVGLMVNQGSGFIWLFIH